MGVIHQVAFWSAIFTFLSVISAEDDTVVLEVPSTATGRSTWHLNFRSPTIQLYQPFIYKRSGDISIPLIGASGCVSTSESPKKCVPLRQCYPQIDMEQPIGDTAWLTAPPETCSYITPQGRQMFGVCCANPSDKENVLNPIETPQLNQIPSNWPPPVPTHPPNHTIPPLPTHPPSVGYPGSVTVATSTTTTKRPTMTFTTKWIRPTTKPTQKPPQASPPASWSCGGKNGIQDQERIVGGHNAELGEWPWIAALFNNGRQFCGGSLIDDVHILSAAHCVAHMTSWDVAKLTVRLADYNIKTNSEVRHIEKKVKRIVRHKGFDPRTLYNDIAILTLDGPVQFNQQVRPICLPSGSDSYANKIATVIGWGSIRENGPQPSVLQEVSIKIWSNTECRQKYGHAAPGGIVEHMLCAGTSSKDSCSGDSGGPLMVNSGKWVQVGVVSWGIGCGKGQYPGVYTRVEKFLPWIMKNLK